MIMKAPSLLLSCLFAVLGFSCNNDKTITSFETERVQSYVPDSTNILEFWTADTIIKTNPKLVQIMDTLYQYVHQKYIDNELDNNIRWMNNYRESLCNYYRETRLSGSISDFAMADSIIEEANILWNLNKDDSTMGMIISNDTELTRLIFQQYNEFEKLNRLCETDKQRGLLKTEFAEWIKLENLFCEIFSNCVSLKYWGGSIAGPIRTSGALEILQAHIDLYKQEYIIISNSGDSWRDKGTFLKPAKNLLIDCCNQALIEYHFSNEISDRYKDIYILKQNN